MTEFLGLHPPRISLLRCALLRRSGTRELEYVPELIQAPPGGYDKAVLFGRLIAPVK
jgi:hypothetical protein